MTITYCKIFEDDGNICVRPEQESRINAAVSQYVDSGGTRDTLLDLETLAGETYYTKASRITSWYVSTPETRRKIIEVEKLLEDEKKAFQADLGIWETP